jgi:hypothetical protein
MTNIRLSMMTLLKRAKRFYTMNIFTLSDIDDCEDKFCGHGNCVDEVNGYSCLCEDGWIGQYCDEGNVIIMLIYKIIVIF